VNSPGFSFKQWFDYLANVVSLSPIRKDEPRKGILDIPEVRGRLKP
jgi:hypothetical protein